MRTLKLVQNLLFTLGAIAMSLSWIADLFQPAGNTQWVMFIISKKLLAGGLAIWFIRIYGWIEHRMKKDNFL